ncbi:MAG: cation:proton antiporter [Candidatus Methanofastidiosia archaeon]
MDIMVEILFLLLAAKIGGEISEYFGYPSIMGELGGGIIVGSSFLNLVSAGGAVERISYIGILLLMFLAGAETNIKELSRSGRSSATVAVVGIVLPFLLGYSLGMYVGFSVAEAMFLGSALTATSVGITVRILLDLKKLNTRVGTTILGAAVIDDVLAVLIFTVVVGIATHNTFSVISFGKIIAVILAFFALSYFVVMRFIKKVVRYWRKLRTEEASESLAIVFILAFAIFAEKAYIAGITGSFIAGIILAQTGQKNIIVSRTKIIGYAFFIPLFFSYVGSTVQVGAFLNIGLLGIAVIVIAVIGKMGGSFIACKAIGFTKKEALTVGVGMIPRMEVAIVIANTGLVQGVVAQPLYSSVIVMVFVTTLITPPLMKLFFR